LGDLGVVEAGVHPGAIAGALEGIFVRGGGLDQPAPIKDLRGILVLVPSELGGFEILMGLNEATSDAGRDFGDVRGIGITLENTRQRGAAVGSRGPD
jgi:uncharacterized membrane protein